MQRVRGDPAARLGRRAPPPRRTGGRVGGQEHFYLEGQVACAAPRQDGCMQLWCSTQHPTEMQHVVAHMLGLAAHRVVVETRRMGGGFGGKESQSGRCSPAWRRWRRGSFAARSSCAPTATTTCGSPASATTSTTTTRSASTTTAACSRCASRWSRAPASPPTCRARSPRARCAMWTTPITCRTSTSALCSRARTRSPTRRFAASAGHRARSRSSTCSTASRARWGATRSTCAGSTSTAASAATPRPTARWSPTT